MGIIKIDNNLGVPKYKQIISCIEEAVLNGVVKKDDKLPSVNSIKNAFSISRDTVLLAYNELKARGIVKSFPGKGYYIKSENIQVVQKIFVLFDELNIFKEDLYNSFLNNLGDHVEVDIYFHHFNPDVFSKLIYDNIGNYNYYIIMPANLPHTEIVIEKLPQDKVYILDQTRKELSQYPAIYQNFEKDIFSRLAEAAQGLKRYRRLILVFDPYKQPQGMLKGFNAFCKMYGFSHAVIDTLSHVIPVSGEVYIVPDDRNLILIIKKIKETTLRISKDVGIISYNDTLLKEIVEGGITTISTDFKAMGARLAQMITNKEQTKIENISKLFLRNSL